MDSAPFPGHPEHPHLVTTFPHSGVPHQAVAVRVFSRGEDAVEIIRQALADFRGLGDHFGEGNAVFLLSWARRESGNLEAAGRAIGAAHVDR